MSTETKLERPQSLTTTAKTHIREAIVAGEFSFGSQLSESVLANRLGVSKTPVREALLQLKHEGLVDVQPQSGTFVFQPTDDQVREICRFREVIETAALRFAVLRDSAALVRRLEETLTADDEVGAAGGSATENAATHPQNHHDAAFHGAILDCSGNPYLQASYRLISDKINALRSRLDKDDTKTDLCHQTHSTIVALIRGGDIAEASKELSIHIRSTEESYIRASQCARGDAASHIVRQRRVGASTERRAP